MSLELARDFQLTDDEHSATKGRLPETLRADMRRSGQVVKARTQAFRKAAVAINAENEMLTAYKKHLELRQDVADLEGHSTNLAALQKRLDAAAKTIQDRELEIANIKAHKLREIAAPAMAVNS